MVPVQNPKNKRRVEVDAMKIRPVTRVRWFLIVFGAVLVGTVWAGLNACTPNSSSSSGAQTRPGDTGSYESHWKVTVAPAQSSMFQSTGGSLSSSTLNTTSVAITVTDPNGAPAPNGTTVYLTCSNGAFGFRTTSVGYNYSQPITTDTRQLTNGKAWIDFIAGFTPGTGSINATFQGVTGTATINIMPTPEATTTTSTSAP
jgi:hypothetical protein